MVSIVLEMLEDGADTKEIIEAYPSLTKKHIKAALQYAGSLVKRGDNVIINVKRQETQIPA